MATADELLASEVCDNVLTVDLDNRIIIIPNTVTNIGVESDDNVEILHFKVPRYYCTIDLSTFKIHVNYKNAKGGEDLYEVKDAVITEDLITFDWVVGRNAVSYRGDVIFSLCLKEFGENSVVLREFNTTTATLLVLPGLETGEAVVQEHIDILDQWRSELFGAGDEVAGNLENLVMQFIDDNSDKLKGDPGEKGDKGDTGPAFTYDMFTSEQLEALTGPSGEDGASIDSIVRTSGTGAAGTTDTYTVTLTDGRTSTFQVYNGADGEGAGDMLTSVYDTKKRNTDIFDYVDNLIGDINTILDEINGE